MYTAIKEVNATDDYKLVLYFDNNEPRIFDITFYLNFGRFVTLKNSELL